MMLKFFILVGLGLAVCGVILAFITKEEGSSVMYQSVIRDPGGNGLVRIHVCDQQSSAVVNGSVLIVGPNTKALVEINGTLSQPYESGRYEIFTDVDPFFGRFKNVMTRFDTATTVSVFFVSTDKVHFTKLGTGALIFREQRFSLTMEAFASCNLSFSISDPRLLLEKEIGGYTSDFSEDNIDMCIKETVISPISEAISREISELDHTQFNSRLSNISDAVKKTIKARLSEFGIMVSNFDVLSITVPAIDQLYSLEQKLAEGIIKNDIDLDELNRIWHGNVNNRTLREMITGFSRSGQAPDVTASNGNMTGMILQMAMMSQLLPALREPLAEITRHTDMFSPDASTANAHPPMPERYKRCSSCNGNVLAGNTICPICGFKINND